MSEDNLPEQINSDPNPNRFSIKRIEEGNLKLTEFPYNEQTFSIGVIKFEEKIPLSGIPGIPELSVEIPIEKKRYEVWMKIEDQGGKKAGELRGFVVDEGKDYYSLYIINLGKVGKGEVYYPGIVTTAITHIVNQEVFLAWYSSTALMQDGVETYKRIAEEGILDTEVVVFRDKDGEYKRTKLTKKKLGGEAKTD